MRRVITAILVALFVVVTTLVAVRFVPGVGEIFGQTSHDLMTDGRCVTNRNDVYALSYALFGKPGPKETRLKVAVTGAGQTPLAGARVIARPVRPDDGNELSASTDPGGNVELMFLEDFKVSVVKLEVDAPGFVEAEDFAPLPRGVHNRWASSRAIGGSIPTVSEFTATDDSVTELELRESPVFVFSQ